MQAGNIYFASGKFYVQYRQGGRRKSHLLDFKSSKVHQLKPETWPRAVVAARDEFMKTINEASATQKPTMYMSVAQFFDEIFCKVGEDGSFGGVCGELKFSTARGYLRLFNFYLRARIGDRLLSDFDQPAIFRLFQEIGQANLATSSLRNVKWLLASVYRAAQDRGYYPGDRKNPVGDVALPKGRRARLTHAYSDVEIAEMLKAVAGNRTASTITILAASTGMRRSEIQGLSWADYTENELYSEGLLGVLRIRRGNVDGVISEPKTERSEREIPCVPELRAALEEYRIACQQRGINTTTGPLFASEVGTAVALNNVLKRTILPALAERGKEKIWRGWHAFRRSLATRLDDRKIDVKSISTILGHAQQSTTTNHYIKPHRAGVAAGMKSLAVQ